MKLDEIRTKHPNKFLKLEILESYTDKDKLIITDVNVIKVIDEGIEKASHTTSFYFCIKFDIIILETYKLGGK